MNTATLVLVQALDGGAAIALAMLVTVILARPVGVERVKPFAPVVAIAIAIAAWFGVASGLAAAGEFSVAANPRLALPLLGLSLLVPLAIGVASPFAFTSIRRLTSEPVVQSALIAVQSLRVIPGAVFLSMAALGVLPAIFAVPAGAGDVLVALAAFPASRWLRAGRWGRVLAWNVIGVFDLLQAIVLGIITTPGQLRLLAVVPSSAWLLVPPLVVVPTFIVPLYLLLHFVSLRYLAQAWNRSRIASAARLELTTS